MFVLEIRLNPGQHQQRQIEQMLLLDYVFFSCLFTVAGRFRIRLIYLFAKPSVYNHYESM